MTATSRSSSRLMELERLFTKMKLEHLEAQLDTVCEQAAKRELDDKAFLAEALSAEWRGRHLKGTEMRLRAPGCRW